MASDIDIVYPIPESWYERVIEHLRYNFFSDEPLNKSVGLVTEGEAHCELEALSMATLKDGMSVVAMDTTKDRIAAVCLNGILCEGDLETSRNRVSKSYDEKYKKIFGFLYGINIKLDLFKKYDASKIFESRILSVDKHYRNLGLALKVICKCEEVAKLNGFNVLKSDLTGLFSQKIFAKVGFETIYELKYTDYKDENDEIVFKTEPPHNTIKIMIKMIES